MDPNIRRKFIPKVKNKLVEAVSTIENVETEDPNFTPQITKNEDGDHGGISAVIPISNNLDVYILNNTAAVTIDAKVSNNVMDESSNSVMSETIITSVAKPIICITAAAGNKSRSKPVTSSLNPLYKVVITDNTVDSNRSVSNERMTDTSTTATTILVEDGINNDLLLKNELKCNDNSNKIDSTNMAKRTKTKIVKMNNKEKDNEESQENKKKTKKNKKNDEIGLRRKRAIDAVLMFIDTWIERTSIEIFEKHSVNKCIKKNDDNGNEKR